MKSYADYIKEKFGTRVQKIALNPGFGCPNRDGKIGVGGCSYCNNKTFSPYYGMENKGIKEQLDEGIRFFSKKYKCQKYIAYFQSYTNTYAPVEELRKLYYSVLEREDVVGLTVATRPDCISNEVLDLLTEISKKYYVTLELGVESCYNQTLKRINRGHNFEKSEKAIENAAEKGLEVCAHLIMYLPGESVEMMMKTTEIMNRLPVKIIKLHQLQVIKGTAMEKDYRENPEDFILPSAEEYADFAARYVIKTPEKIYERFVSESPREMVAAPDWHGKKNYEITELIKKKISIFANEMRE